MRYRSLLRELRSGLRSLEADSTAALAGGSLRARGAHSASRPGPTGFSASSSSYRRDALTRGVPASRSFASQPLPADLKDPTGIWQYELNTEQLSRAGAAVRAHEENRFLETMQASVFARLPESTLQVCLLCLYTLLLHQDHALISLLQLSCSCGESLHHDAYSAAVSCALCRP